MNHDEELYRLYSGGNSKTRIYEREFIDNFLRYCTLVCVLNNKKLNLANIFILTLKSPHLRSVYKTLCDVDNDYDALKYFLEYDVSLHKSKYIKKYLNSAPVKLRK
jgi:hypothetical protein